MSSHRLARVKQCAVCWLPLSMSWNENGYIWTVNDEVFAFSLWLVREQNFNSLGKGSQVFMDIALLIYITSSSIPIYHMPRCREGQCVVASKCVCGHYNEPTKYRSEDSTGDNPISLGTYLCFTTSLPKRVICGYSTPGSIVVHQELHDENRHIQTITNSKNTCGLLSQLPRLVGERRMGH